MTTINPSSMEVAMSDGALSVRIADAGEMAVLRALPPAGTNMTEALRAVDPKGCQVPHWMYVISGELHMGYNDGRVDVAKAGEFLCAEPGHVPWVDVDTEFIEVSPRAAARDLLAKLTGG